MIKKLITAWFKKRNCMHNWSFYSKRYMHYFSLDDAPDYEEHTLLCTKCGKIKKIKV